MNFLSKKTQIFDTYNFKKALKRVGLIQEVIYSCFAAYGMRVGKKVEQSGLFVVLFCFRLLKVWNIFFCVSSMICQRVSVPMTIKVFFVIKLV